MIRVVKKGRDVSGPHVLEGLYQGECASCDAVMECDAKDLIPIDRSVVRINCGKLEKCPECGRNMVLFYRREQELTELQQYVRDHVPCGAQVHCTGSYYSLITADQKVIASSMTRVVAEALRDLLEDNRPYG